MSAWVPQERHPRPRRLLTVAAFCLWLAAAVGLVVVALRAAGTPYAPWLGVVVFLAALVLVRGDQP